MSEDSKKIGILIGLKLLNVILIGGGSFFDIVPRKIWCSSGVLCNGALVPEMIKEEEEEEEEEEEVEDDNEEEDKNLDWSWLFFSYFLPFPLISFSKSLSSGIGAVDFLAGKSVILSSFCNDSIYEKTEIENELNFTNLKN